MKKFFEETFMEHPQILEAYGDYYKTEVYKKNDILLWPGEVCRKIYYIEEGTVMLRYTEGDIDKAISFHFEGDYFTSSESYWFGTPSEYYIQCLENCKLSYFRKDQFEELAQRFKEVEKIIGEYYQSLYIKQFQITSRLTSYSVEKMYDYIVNTHPKILQQVPLKFVAEFMGISKEHLSRLRKKMASTSS